MNQSDQVLPQSTPCTASRRRHIAWLPRISQETLAEMIGMTRSRVNFFVNKFKKLGFIEYNGGLKVNHCLLTVIVHE
jgi:DNA-binding transcriptional regulator LsrR (DeoR family)